MLASILIGRFVTDRWSNSRVNIDVLSAVNWLETKGQKGPYTLHLSTMCNLCWWLLYTGKFCRRLIFALFALWFEGEFN